jgi:hypothetical protein
LSFLPAVLEAQGNASVGSDNIQRISGGHDGRAHSVWLSCKGRPKIAGILLTKILLSLSFGRTNFTREVGAMAAKTVSLIFACALGMSFGLMGTPTARAITWDFSTPPGANGTSQNYTGITLTATGFSDAQLATGTPIVNLFGKNLGGDEVGLGFTSDPAGENEITGTSLVRIAMAAGLSGACIGLLALARRRRKLVA